MIVYPSRAAAGHVAPGEEAAVIHRDRESKEATLGVRTAGAWELFSGPSPVDIDYERPILTGKLSGFFALPTDTRRRSYFAFRQNGRTSILAERRLPMQGGYNFRDLGGIRTTDGRRILWGRMFRSDNLCHLSDDDLAYLASIPIRTVADFRTETEVERSPDSLPPSVKDYMRFPMAPGRLDPKLQKGGSTLEQWNAFMLEVSELLITEEATIERYREFFRHVQNPEQLPLLYHCSAGKDRTGMATIFFLLALGVDADIVREDYLASAKYLSGKYDAFIAEHPERAPLFSVRPEYFDAALGAMIRTSGSVEGYLTEMLQLDIPLLRSMYLEEAR